MSERKYFEQFTGDEIDPVEYAALLYSDAVLTGEVNRLVAENHELRTQLEKARKWSMAWRMLARVWKHRAKSSSAKYIALFRSIQNGTIKS